MNDLQAHFKRNEAMWNLWLEHGIKPEMDFTVNFHFYAANPQSADLLEAELRGSDLEYRRDLTRTLFIFKGWRFEVDVRQKWTLELLQAKMGYMHVLSLQTGTSLEGCGAMMPS